MLTVRAARADDLGAIVKLERYCFPPEVAFGRSRWHYLLNQAKGRTLLLQDEKAQVMGYLSVLEHKGWDRLIIQTLAIRWTVRRQGWARRLLEQVIREGREAGWGAIRLEVADAISVDGRRLLKRDLESRLNGLLHSGRVRAVLFTEYVVQ